MRARCSLGPGGLPGCGLTLSRLPGRKSQCRGNHAGAWHPLGLAGLHPGCGHVATRPAPGVPPQHLHQDALRALTRSRMVRQAIAPRSQAGRWPAWCAGRSRRGSASVGLSRLNSVARHRVWPANTGGCAGQVIVFTGGVAHSLHSALPLDPQGVSAPSSRVRALRARHSRRRGTQGLSRHKPLRVRFVRQAASRPGVLSGTSLFIPRSLACVSAAGPSSRTANPRPMKTDHTSPEGWRLHRAGGAAASPKGGSLQYPAPLNPESRSPFQQLQLSTVLALDNDGTKDDTLIHGEHRFIGFQREFSST